MTKLQSAQLDPRITETIPDLMFTLLAHPAISLGAYERRRWPIGWTVNEFNELEPECAIDLHVARGWCVDDCHGLTIESLDDVECALLSLTECDCSWCRYDETDAYSEKEWA